MFQDEYVFYFAGVLVVGAYSRGLYNLWLLDYGNRTKTDAWVRGVPAPSGECVQANVHWTLGEQAPVESVHFAEISVMDKLKVDKQRRLPLDMIDNLFTPATVAINSELWCRIRKDDLPLPKGNRDQDYRLKLVTRKDGRSYMGFHVRVLDVDVAGSRLKVQFYDWMDGSLGSGDWVHVPSVVEDVHSSVKLNSGIGMTGSLFVSVEYVYTTVHLSGPKVPWGAKRPRGGQS